MDPSLLVPLFATLLCYFLFRLGRMVYNELTSPIRHFPGPKNNSWIVGNFFDMADEAPVTTKWREEFGPHFQFRGLLNKRKLYTSDTKAINHIVTNTNLYGKGPVAVRGIQTLLGNGILSVEGDPHKKQASNPAFGTAQIRRLTELFVEQSLQLRDVWSREITKSAATGDRKDSARIEITAWVRRVTLDMIGHAGFNYQFNALEPQGKPSELNQAFTELFHSPNARIALAFRSAQAMFPFLRFLPLPGQKVVKNAKAKMYDIGHELLLDGKAAVKAAGGDKDFSSRRDLFSLLLKANMAADVPGKSRLSDEEVIALSGRLFRTSTAITWALYALSQNQSAQNKLRAELMTVSTDHPTMEELSALPYLENVVRETLRVHTPLVSVTRMAMVDDILPLSIPYTDPTGVVHDSIPITKGQEIYLPLLAVNTDKSLWGEDATEFKPERWDHLPEAVKAIPSVWSHLMTFFAGPHNCIGFRFSVAEQKALLFTLIRAFEFELAIPASEIGSTGTLQRPFLLADRKKGDQMPMIVKSCSRV
ncbi:cytochrome P450 [Mycena albidolilacea]|uniref:Cytochrome P450 n=1 Tax=Mycena albidolilacea TaxID=1033008 RepID=A0AAD6ZHT9_9AGAR|nr:cytochrome P450 [Mycena albidolilacea]